VKYYIHAIEKKQSLYSISKLYNVTLDDIYAINPEAKNGTRAGQEIKIPVKPASSVTTATTSTVKNPTTTATKTQTLIDKPPMTVDVSLLNPIDTTKYYTYTVGKKETLYAITRKFNITEAELKIWNPVLITSGLKEGQVIITGEKPKKAVVTATVTPTIITNPDSLNPHVIHKAKKTAYTVALILPFKLEQSLALDLGPLLKNHSNFPAVPALAVDFYLGFKRAVDSLRANDFDVNIQLYDGDDRDSLTLAKIVNDPEFKLIDMIFGPLYANGFKVIAQKAKENGIPIVSPITQSNKMLFDNVYASKTNPSMFTLMESLADYCMDSLAINNARVILASKPGVDAKEAAYVNAFKKYYNDRLKQLGRPVTDTVCLVKGLAGVKSVFSSGGKNIVITLSNNQVFVTDFTTQLAIFSDKKDVTFCSWQTVTNINDFDQEYLNQMHFTFPCENNISNACSYSVMAQSYKEQQNTMPGEYYFIGFDIAYYYMKNLKESGTDFVFKLNTLPAETNYMRFKFTRPDNTTGFDNRGVYIFRYNNYKLEKTGWK
jgi:LysM repeat protein